MNSLDIIFLSSFLVVNLLVSLIYFYDIFKTYQLKMYFLKDVLSNFKTTNLDSYLFKITILFNVIFIILTHKIFCYISLLIFYTLAILLVLKNKKTSKNKLVFTKRFVRFFVTFILLNLLFFSFSFFLLVKTSYFAIFFVNFYLLNILVFIVSHILLYPLEKLIKLKYILKAKKKLKECKNLIVVGITGSFGKTSVKNYLYTLLKEKYKVCKSQKSFNTDMGITKVILNDLKPDDEILILEMGADRIGDINKLCKIVKPNYSIVTGVTNQHLKTFKTFENIIKTKFELIENTKENGEIVLNAENDITLSYFDKTKIKTHLVGENTQFFAKDIKLNFNGTSFVLLLDGKYILIETKLLGRHNVVNLLMAIKMGQILGLNSNEILKGVKNIERTSHRLDLIENNGKYILDDSFNANSEGVKHSIEVLKLFPNKKIVITAGIVELGKDEYRENYNLGKLLKEIDYVIITNHINKQAILDGLEDRRKNVFLVNNLQEALKILNDIFSFGDCVLFLNDLPDCYA